MPSMSQIAKPSFNQSLKALESILDKLAAHCVAKKIDEAVFLAARLYPDMFAFSRQVQIACDFAKGATARLSGRENPSFVDDEKSIADLKMRITKTLAFVNAVPDSEFDGTEGKEITMKIRDQSFAWPGATYLVNVALPNFQFHVTTAYAILRHNGVEIGKGDFLGRG